MPDPVTQEADHLGDPSMHHFYIVRAVYMRYRREYPGVGGLEPDGVSSSSAWCLGHRKRGPGPPYTEETTGGRLLREK